MIRLLAVAILVLFIAACGGCETGKPISEKQYGRSNWPLTVSEATLHCRYVAGVRNVKMVWVESEGYAYPVNGTAKSTLQSEMPWLKIQPIDRIWRNSPTVRGTRVNIMPLINDGLAVC